MKNKKDENVLIIRKDLEKMLSYMRMLLLEIRKFKKNFRDPKVIKLLLDLEELSKLTLSILENVSKK